MTCPVCNSTQLVRKIHELHYSGKDYTISGCKECGCWFYDPFPTPDYAEDLSSEMSLRHYLETSAGIEILATLGENFYSNYVKGAKRGLEIGCGFGFVSHYLEFMHGQQMTAYEPSQYGVKGREMLGLNIITDYFKSDGKDTYDYCISTEVIEHITDPVAFAADILKSLTDNGKLLLSTPDKDSIDMERKEPLDMALLSPGMHTVLFSRSSLTKMLHLAGFSHVIIKSGGATLYAIASRTPFAEKELFSTDFAKLAKYYQHVYTMAPQESPLQKGLFYRLFRLYVDFGMYEEGAQLLKSNPYFHVITDEEIAGIHTESDLMRFYSLTDSIIYFYCGILYLNYLMNFEKAVTLFRLSFLACKKRLLIVAQFAILDVDIIWQSKLHEGIANEQLGRPLLASACYFEIISFTKNKDNVPVAKESIVADAKSRLKRLIDSL
jgi:SAM-dependent methyltransferase